MEAPNQPEISRGKQFADFFALKRNLVIILIAIYAYPGGVLTDRWGHRRAFITFNLVSIAGYALVLLIPRWGAVIAGMFLFLSWTCFSLPATFSLVGATLEAN